MFEPVSFRCAEASEFEAAVEGSTAVESQGMSVLTNDNVTYWRNLNVVHKDLHLQFICLKYSCT